MRELPKRTRKALREFAARAHERELRDHLARLAISFARWEAGELGTWELSDLIHEFHNGPSRQLYSYYTQVYPEIAVARAIAAGILKESEIPSEVMEAIGPMISMFRDLGREAGETVSEQD